MHPNQQYNDVSLMGFQMSVLRLGAALEQAAPVGSQELATVALVEAERLKDLIESHER
jgi:hypothetical protein